MGDGVGTPSESDSSYSNCTESIAQAQLYSDRSIKHGLSYSEINQTPSHSYVAIISMAILSKPDKKCYSMIYINTLWIISPSSITKKKPGGTAYDIIFLSTSVS
ncbi:Hypothetical predicted protein [Mytilus galloprovincialis]|uniref:Uncharacterized protein n=1 Tax=Mytilus galloprovincialis TaxID=29158 RepID=A0A8B6D8T6_MYTGA|nr:Hypothetical predicted protein [Mytilus galloprovincialis]